MACRILPWLLAASLAPVSSVQAQRPAGRYKLRSSILAGAHRSGGMLRLRSLGGASYLVERSVRCRNGERAFRGLGRLERSSKGARLRVRFLEATSATQYVAHYQLTDRGLLGVFRGPNCARDPGLVWFVEDARREERRATPARTARRAPAPPRAGIASHLGEASLPTLLAATVAAARAELARGVRETRGPNRSERIDHYARGAGMPLGGAWCGYFLGFVYAEGARAHGRTFQGQRVVHSVGKTRAFFLYRAYTQRWTSSRVAVWEELRASHKAAGSARRFITLRGSSGQRYAARFGLAHEAYERYQDLPIGPGDTVLWSWGKGKGHIGLVERYDPASGRLVTLEGNAANSVARRTRDLSKARVRQRIDSFGRPARGDFTHP